MTSPYLTRPLRTEAEAARDLGRPAPARAISETCGECAGTGQLWHGRLGWGDPSGEWRECRPCDGSGVVMVLAEDEE